MALIQLRKPWTRQPQIVCDVDTSHPLLSQCEAFIVPAFPGPAGSLVRPTTRNTTGFSTNATRLGLGRKFSNTEYDYWDDAGLSSKFTQKLTYFALLQFDTYSNGGFVLGNVAPAAAGYNHGLYLGSSNKGSFFVKTGGSGASASAVGASLLGSGVVAMVGTYDGANITLHTYVFGSGAYEKAQTAKTGNLDTTSLPLSLARWNSANQFTGTFIFGGVNASVWSDAAVMDWIANPWQLFAPRTITIPLAAAAGGAPTISALSARLITATSAQPRISYS